MRDVLKYIIGLLPFLLVACSDPAPQIPNNKIQQENPTESFMELNKEFAAIEDSMISSYMDSLSVPFTTTKSGIRYYITKEGDGDTVSATDDVTYRYSVRMLDGTSCEKLTDVVKTVNLEKSELERGYREALRLLKVSGTGVFVMPSFMAYGVIGVPNCIPAWTPVECTITLLEVTKK